MVDDLRDLVKKSEYSDDGLDLYDEYEKELQQKRFLGMTSAQRFVVSLMLLSSVIVIGSMCLLLTEKMAIF